MSKLLIIVASVFVMLSAAHSAVAAEEMCTVTRGTVSAEGSIEIASERIMGAAEAKTFERKFLEGHKANEFLIVYCHDGQ